MCECYAFYGLSLVLSDSLLAAILPAVWTYCVIHIVSTTVGAYSKCRSYSLVVGSALESTGFGLSSFRMCHFSLNF